jgi:hypothetical protein
VPPSANPITGTVDLFYELDNSTRQFNPGQRIAAALTLRSPTESLTVPWSAVMHDIHGGTWVYEQSGEFAFVRRRVVLSSVTGDAAVLETGPPAGTPIVVAGAAELYGTETGFTK